MSIETLRDIVEYAVDTQHPRAKEAAKQLEAVERAAKEWVETDGQLGPGKMRRLDALLRSIATETP